MAKHRGRGFATIEYPTGMNQNGDPSQAWIKLKPDGRVDVFSGTVDIGQGSKTVHTQIVADALGDEYRSMTDERRTGDLLPEHLVAQQAPESAERLATYDPNGGGH